MNKNDKEKLHFHYIRLITTLLCVHHHMDEHGCCNWQGHRHCIIQDQKRRYIRVVHFKIDVCNVL